MNLILKLCGIGLVALLVGCDQVSALFGPPPEKVLAAYLDATKTGNWEQAYQYISTKDRADEPLATYKAKSTDDNGFASAIRSKTTYKVLSINREGDKATAKVEITSPDFTGMYADLLGGALASALRGKDPAELQKQLASKIETATLPTRVQTEDMVLVKESQGWRVFLDWTTKKKVSALLEAAETLRKEKKLIAARDKYDAVLQLDGKLVTAQMARDELGREIEKFNEKQAYVGSIDLYDLRARYFDTYLEKHIPGVEFKLRNNGSQSLRKIEVTVYFEDSTGAVIAEEAFHPVLVSEYSFRQQKPLRPNYIWQMERGQLYTAKSVPSEWREGAVKAKITDIEFAKPGE